MLVVVLERLERLRKVLRSLCDDLDVCGFDSGEAKLERREQAGEPHSTERGIEELTAWSGDVATGRRENRGTRDVLAEASGAMMVLPMNIGGECTARGDVTGSRGDWDEEAMWNDRAHDLIEGVSRGDGEQPSLPLEFKRGFPQRWIGDETPGVEGRVTIGSTEAARSERRSIV